MAVRLLIASYTTFLLGGWPTNRTISLREGEPTVEVGPRSCGAHTVRHGQFVFGNGRLGIYGTVYEFGLHTAMGCTARGGKRESGELSLLSG